MTDKNTFGLDVGGDFTVTKGTFTIVPESRLDFIAGEMQRAREMRDAFERDNQEWQKEALALLQAHGIRTYLSPDGIQITSVYPQERFTYSYKALRRVLGLRGRRLLRRVTKRTVDAAALTALYNNGLVTKGQMADSVDTVSQQGPYVRLTVKDLVG